MSGSDLLITASPHLGAGASTPTIMWNVVGSLAPLVIVATWFFGPSALLVISAAEVKAEVSYPCIRCGHCLDACPVFLNPQLLGQLALKERWDEMEANHLADCMLCGCCGYTCPSNIPLPQLFTLAKSALRRKAA